MAAKKPKNQLEVSVVIPNYNGEELLKKNLPAVLAAQKEGRNRIGEIIVVDDGSFDGSVSLIKRRFPEVKLIKHRINRGFSAAVNTGARSSKGQLLALLNTDVVPEADFLVKALVHFKEKDIFAVSLHERGYGWAKGRFKEGFIVHEPGREGKRVHETFWISGGSGVFRRSYWMKLKGMDEKLLSPFYWEDVDLSYRALKRGWRLVWEPQALVLHQHETTMAMIPNKFRQRIQERNQLIFIWKNLTSPILFRKHVTGLFRRMARHPGYTRIVFSALTKFRGILKARKVEKKEGKVSDEAILTRFK